jgi:thioredoxin 1
MSSNSRPDGLKAMNVLVGVILLIAFVGYVVLSRPGSGPDATELPEGEFKRAVLESDVPVLVDFYADWCGPCRKMSSVIDEFAEGNPNIKIMRINVDKNQELARHYEIRSIPTLMVFKNGKMTARSSGGMSKSSLKSFLEQ